MKSKIDALVSNVATFIWEAQMKARTRSAAIYDEPCLGEAARSTGRGKYSPFRSTYFGTVEKVHQSPLVSTSSAPVPATSLRRTL
eukprot:scaffold150799_cov27-Tisochrysis_lutea.AAC.1